MTPTSEDGSTSEKPSETYCGNCGARLAGPFCSACGQEARDFDLTLRQLLGHGLEAFFSFDRRLLETLRLLALSPGRLTEVFLEGKRRAYVPPFKLYLGVSLVAFLLLSLGSESVVHFQETSDGGRLSTTEGKSLVAWGFSAETDLPEPPAPSAPSAPSEAEAGEEKVLEQEEPATLETGKAPEAHSVTDAFDEDARGFDFGQKLERAIADPAELARRYEAALPRAIFALVPVLAFFTAAVYVRRRRPFSHHLVFSLHLHSLGFLTIATSALSTLVFNEEIGDQLQVLGILWCLCWLALGQRRVFGDGKIKTWLRMFVVMFAYTLALAMTLGATFLALVLVS